MLFNGSKSVLLINTKSFWFPRIIRIFDLSCVGVGRGHLIHKINQAIMFRNTYELNTKTGL